MFYLVELLILVLFSALIKWIRSLRFYNWVISNNWFTYYEWTRLKERIAYSLTKFVMRFPSLSLTPLDYEYNMVAEEYRQAVKRGEKFLIFLHQWWLHVKGVLGNIVADMILLISILIREKVIDVNKIWSTLKDIDIDWLELVEMIIDFCTENSNILLVGVIILLALYSKYIKKKGKKYEFEAIWKRESADDVEKVAKNQKIIEKTLSSLTYPIYKNLLCCRENIKRFDACDGNYESVTLLNEYEDFSADISTIKECLKEISSCDEGATIYRNHNKNMMLQLKLLGLFPRTEFIYFELDECNKQKFEVRDTGANLRAYLKYKWGLGIAVLNGLDRVLYDSAKRKYGYNRLLLSIESHERISDMVEKIKK